jgi:anti-sigma B factor antagonist
MEPGTAIAPDLSVSTWTANGVTIAELSGELVAARAPDLRDGLVGLLQFGSSQIIVELSRVTDCDDGGLAVLVGVEHRARAAGGFLRLAAASPPVQRVLGVTGLHLHLVTFPTIQAAISGRGVPADPDAAEPAERRLHAASQARALAATSPQEMTAARSMILTL